MYRTVTKRVKPSWKELFETTGLKEKLEKCLYSLRETCDESQITPPVPDILNWARFTDLNNIKIIILGQDPYPGAGDADGLCFSTNSPKCPGSLQNILRCLARSGLTTKISKVYNLYNWAIQGVLLLNTCFTTEVGQIKGHRNIWPLFTNALIESISKYYMKSNKIIIWMLWGKEAQRKSEFINDCHLIYEFSHPSPQNGTTFLGCTHFLDANQELEDQGRSQIIWDPVIRHIVYTDGSANLRSRKTKDGGANKNSVAAWAFCISDGPLRKKRNTGIVKIKEKLRIYELNDEGVMCPKYYTAYPTNIRAEGIAILKALSTIYNYPVRYRGIITIKTDSDFWYNVFNIWKWIPSQIDMIKPKDIRKQKNIDIIEMLQILRAAIENEKTGIGRLDIQCITAAHELKKRDEIPDEDDEEAFQNYLCNDEVDLLANTTRIEYENK